MRPEGRPRSTPAGIYDYNWNWYDAAGRRVITHVTQGSTYVPDSSPSTAGCCRNFYVYDGDDVALQIVRGASNTWWVKARYLTGGLDNQLAGRFRSSTGVRRNLALVNDYRGTTLGAIKWDGGSQPDATFIQRDPYGGSIGASGTGAFNTETGFAGASTPNQTGGFTYLRNRWYDPQTGRFLTQDPIGLAGGVNLYAYAGCGAP